MSYTNKKMSFSSAHFIGIGGSGMSGIALVLHERGCKVTGSDLKESHYVRTLEAAGIDVRLGHSAEVIDELMPDVVVISSAVHESNVELARARELGITIWRRAKMLSALSEDDLTIAVAGTHGKTTTSSMIATALDHLGLDPSFLIGGVVEEYDTNGRNGGGDYFVCEADESDGSFMYLNPNIAVITNIEEDHLDHYGTLENLEKTFCEFMSLVGNDGHIVINGDNTHYIDLAKSTGCKYVTFGFNDYNDYVCTLISAKGFSLKFEVKMPTGEVVSLDLAMSPGLHNVLDATACMAVTGVLGMDPQKAAQALSEYKGARRRFTKMGCVSGITVVDDYGHNPTEIIATLTAANALDEYKRVVELFQPHRYTRTKLLKEQFRHAFDLADVLYIMDVFPASETPIPGISGKTIANEVIPHGDVKEIYYIPNRRELINHLCDHGREGDLVITQGCGDVTLMGPMILTALRERANNR